ncbi:hypothetical protein HOK96_02000 [bacterium]|nr:hypothetical protein [bacterium]MBT3903280.1 hypothetical protein [bacterium]MBT5345805.1 hypothetical protein [bacterium]
MENSSQQSDFKYKLKGFLYIFAGIVLLLDRMHLLQDIVHYLILIGGLFLISYGVIITRLYKVIGKLIWKKSEPKPDQPIENE